MKTSAGLLVYRKHKGQVEALIAHPGGPFFARKDEGFWSIPKGLHNNGEDPLSAAKREYEEEIGSPPPIGEYLELGEIKRQDGKIIKAWAVKGDVNEKKIKSNFFELEWPPRSGKKEEFPEIDRAIWASLEVAARKIQPAQIEFLRRLAKHLKTDFEPPMMALPKQNTLF